MLQDVCSYTIEVSGEVDESRINKRSPLHVQVVCLDPSATRFNLSADQSGLIGLLRHLHGQGFVLLSVFRGSEAAKSFEEDLFDE